jgi:putative hydrolase of the HAD superfamily
MTYKNIIFDLGNVIVRLDESATMQAFEQLGLGKFEHVRDNPETLKLFQGMGLGLISNEEYFSAFRHIAREDLTDEQIANATNAMLRYIPDVKKQKLMDLRKAGYRTFLLSNTIDLHWRYCCENLFAMGPYSVDDYFERTFVSQEMHMKKPNDDIFQEVIRETGICPTETLFIDDLMVNCQAAERNGMHAFHNKDFDDWMTLF